jgi:putative methyltransferase (TIGR04325 family)
MGIYDSGERLLRSAWRVPLLGTALRAAYSSHFARMPPNRFHGVHPDFAAAQRAIPQGARIGYDHDALQGMYRLRMDKACESDYAVLFWLRGLLGADMRVFDFGGHVGVSWYGWRKYLHFAPGQRWLVCDVPAIVAEGEALARERGAQGLAFTSRIEDGAGCDVLLVAGSLQYVDLSLPQLIAQLGSRPPHVLVNKLPVHPSESFVTVQSTGRAFHPYRIYHRDAFVDGVTALGYRLVDEWANREQYCRIPFTRGMDVEAYSGFYFVREDVAPTHAG